MAPFVSSSSSMEDEAPIFSPGSASHPPALEELTTSWHSCLQQGQPSPEQWIQQCRQHLILSKVTATATATTTTQASTRLLFSQDWLSSVSQLQSSGQRLSRASTDSTAADHTASAAAAELFNADVIMLRRIQLQVLLRLVGWDLGGEQFLQAYHDHFLHGHFLHGHSKKKKKKRSRSLAISAPSDLSTLMIQDLTHILSRAPFSLPPSQSMASFLSSCLTTLTSWRKPRHLPSYVTPQLWEAFELTPGLPVQPLPTTSAAGPAAEPTAARPVLSPLPPSRRRPPKRPLGDLETPHDGRRKKLPKKEPATTRRHQENDENDPLGCQQAVTAPASFRFNAILARDTTVKTQFVGSHFRSSASPLYLWQAPLVHHAPKAAKKQKSSMMKTRLDARPIDASSSIRSAVSLAAPLTAANLWPSAGQAMKLVSGGTGSHKPPDDDEGMDSRHLLAEAFRCLDQRRRLQQQHQHRRRPK